MASGSRKNSSKKKGKESQNTSRLRRQFFREAAEEDLANLDRTDIDTLLHRAEDFLSFKQPGQVKVRLENVQLGKGALAERVILEILNDDMPFLVDSTVNALTQRGLTVQTILHPVLTCMRNKKGDLLSFGTGRSDGDDFLRESYIHIHLQGSMKAAQQKDLLSELKEILADVRAAVMDWKPMLRVIQGHIDSLRTDYSPLPTAIISETVDFLNWLQNNRFTFLGLCQYNLEKSGGKSRMVADVSSALGILRSRQEQVIQDASRRDMSKYKSGYAVLVDKSNIVSRVHRPVVMDYVGLYQFDKTGNIIGELRIIGLFASSAYTEAATSIPLLRRRIEAVMSLSGFSHSGHSGKGLMNVLETMSRDDLFQIESEQLTPLALGMWRLQERPRTRVFVRLDRFERYAIAYVFFPRDRFSSALRETASEILEDAYKGKTLEFIPNFGEGTLVRVRYIVSLGRSKKDLPKVSNIEAKIVEATRDWGDRLVEALRSDSEYEGIASSKYASAFPPAYQDAYGVADALGDISTIESLTDAANTAVELAPPVAGHGAARLKLFHLGAAIPLSARLPLLEDMGLRALDENTYVVQPSSDDAESTKVFIHEVALNRDAGASIDPESFARLESCFMAVWTGKVDSDKLNGLVLAASATWQEVNVLRACVRYLRQTGFPYLVSTISGTLIRNPDVTRLLIDLFNIRFDPKLKKVRTLADRDKAQSAILKKIDARLATIPSLDDDRIIRHISGVIAAIMRTNFFALDELQGEIPISLAMKIRSKNVPGIPAPVPYAEIFVHSTLVEGVHLRGGPIARGGLRWSDRAEDFRTEVLGLVKAQNVKNSVIVPVGAKGGFIPRQLPIGGSRDEIYSAGTLAYQSFVSSLLSVTDNTKNDKIIPPDNVVRHDGDDSYLVVAADKGTAAFSDVANAISTDADFWLDDAFASGGSAGYDHKKMGITARGGWEAVKRHFREMDRDIQTTPFTAVGVGDMSGDVFGNGMLLSEQTQVVAAFDHRDIFIDPSPDVSISFKERKRLFEMPRSSWQDYNRKLISKGGGVFSRSEKQISLTPEIKSLLNLSANSATPNELMRAIIKCDADLLWFGGIGTYVRGKTETDADAGDKANDAIRVTASELNVKAVGEGANLGMTQLARIEFSLKGGRINTDAIDNSAGVNSSDVEVNLKIALGAAEAAGKLQRAARNRLLAAMTDEVADLVLRNNYLQTLCLSLIEDHLAKDKAGVQRVMRELENRGGLDRDIEFLPSGDEFEERMNAALGMSRPEMSVVVSYAKIVLFNDMMAQGVANDAYFEQELLRYFPKRMVKNFKSEILDHKLRNEIISTLLANSVVNRCGPGFLFDLANDTGVEIGQLSKLYILARDSFGFTALNGAVDNLDNKISGDKQLALYHELQAGLTAAVEWFAGNEGLGAGLTKTVEAYSKGLSTITGKFAKLLPAAQRTAVSSRSAQLKKLGLDQQSAAWIAGMKHSVSGLDIVQIASQRKKSVEETASTYFEVSDLLGIDEILDRADALDMSNNYDRLAITGIRQTIQRSLRSIAADAVSSRMSGERKAQLSQLGDDLRSVAQETDFSLAKFAVIASQLGTLAKG